MVKIVFSDPKPIRWWTRLRMLLPPSNTKKAMWCVNAAMMPITKKVSIFLSALRFLHIKFWLRKLFQIFAAPFGKRSWKMFYCTLRDLVLYLHKDENGFRKSQVNSGCHPTKMAILTNRSHSLSLSISIIDLDVRQCTQCNSYPSCASNKSNWLQEEAARVSSSDGRSVWVSIPNQRSKGTAIMDWYNQFCMRFVFGATVRRRCRQPKTIPTTTSAVIAYEIAFGTLTPILKCWQRNNN